MHFIQKNVIKLTLDRQNDFFCCCCNIWEKVNVESTITEEYTV